MGETIGTGGPGSRRGVVPPLLSATVKSVEDYPADDEEGDECRAYTDTDLGGCRDVGVRGCWVADVDFV